MKVFRFLDLPRELRDYIYEATLRVDELHIPSACWHPGAKFAEQPALIRVCCQIRQEALPLFYQLNTFVAHIHRADFSYSLSYINIIGSSNVRNLRRVDLRVGDRGIALTCGAGLLDFVRWYSVTEERLIR